MRRAIRIALAALAALTGFLPALACRPIVVTPRRAVVVERRPVVLVRPAPVVVVR